MSLKQTFKVPKLAPKTDKTYCNFESFNWQDVIREEEIGRGSFGTVFRGTHIVSSREKRSVVVKVMNDVHGSAKEFKKEAKLLHDLYSFKSLKYSRCYEFSKVGTFSRISEQIYWNGLSIFFVNLGNLVRHSKNKKPLKKLKVLNGQNFMLNEETFSNMA